MPAEGAPQESLGQIQLAIAKIVRRVNLSLL
eukprot:COSAG02_NODE_27877_length_601_cov_0.637450_1_plen_30_part_01